MTVRAALAALILIATTTTFAACHLTTYECAIAACAQPIATTGEQGP